MARFKRFAGRSRRFVSRFRSRFMSVFPQRRKRRRKSSRNILPRKVYGIPMSLLLILSALLFFTPLGKSLKDKIKF